MNWGGIKSELLWLGNHSLQAGVLVLMVLLAQWIFRRKLNNRWRFALWWLVVARLLLPFSLQSTASVFNFLQPNLLWHRAQAVQIVEASPLKTIPPVEAQKAPAGLSPVIETPVAPAENNPEIETQATSPVPATALPKRTQTTAAVLSSQQPPVSEASMNWSEALCPGLAALWAGGVLVLSGMVIARVASFYRKIAKASTPCEPELQQVLDDCRREFSISRRVELLETSVVESPALFGLVRLRLLLPKGIGRQFCERELRYVFLHELAHVKRGDLWLNWLVTALQIVHWFNPLIWFGFARLRADRELACDEMALMRSGDNTSKAYGETVVKLLENLSRPTAIPGLVGILEDKNQMRTRISMIANFRKTGRWSLLAVILIGALTLIGLTDKRNVASASTPDDSGLRLTIDLRDGSHVTGKCEDEEFRFHSASLGNFKLPLAGIRSIELAPDGDTAHLKTTNDDLFDVQFVATSLKIKTGFGKIELPVKSVRSLRVSAVVKVGQMSAGLASLWSGEDNANDSVGGNNGILTGEASFDKGVVGRAFRFSQMGDKVTAPTTGLPIGNSDRTMAGWIYIDSFIPGGEAFIAGYGQFNVNQAYLLTVPPNHNLTFSQWGNGVDGPTLTTGRWYHVAVTSKGENVQLYLDGEPVASGILPFNTPAGTTLYIGGLNASGRPQQMLGKIDEMAIYDRALSDDEIKAIYKAGAGKKSPGNITQTSETSFAGNKDMNTYLTVELQDGCRVMGKSIDETLKFHSETLGDLRFGAAEVHSIEFAASGESAKLTMKNGDKFDAQFINPSMKIETEFGKVELPKKLIHAVRVSMTSVSNPLAPSVSGLVALWCGEGNALDAMGEDNGMIGGNVSYGPGKDGMAFHFDGLDSYVNVGNPDNLQLQNFTIEGWIKRFSDSVASRNAPNGELFGAGEGGYAIGLWSDGRLYLTKSGVDNLAVNTGIVDTNFHHIAVTKSGYKVVFYVDGVAFSTPPYYKVFAFGSTFSIGAQGGDQAAPFYGAIDELGIFNRALTEKEIQQLYNDGNDAVALMPDKKTAFTPQKANSPAAKQTTNEIGFHLSIRLRDGSLVNGKALDDVLKFRSVSLGDLKLPLSGIRSFEFKNGGEAAHLTTTTGDVFDATPAFTDIRIETGFGKTQIPTKLIRDLRISLMKSGNGNPEGLVARWSAENNADDSVNGNSGKLIGGTSYGNGVAGQAFRFSDFGDQITAPAAGLPFGNKDRTMECWVYIHSFVPGVETFFAGYGEYSDERASILTVLPNHRVGFSQWRRGVGGPVLKSGRWYHVAATTTGNDVKLYVNGEVVATGNIPIDTAADSTLNIGGVNAPFNTRQLIGKIDELSIYDRALSDDEIKAIYETGQPNIPDEPAESWNDVVSPRVNGYGPSIRFPSRENFDGDESGAKTFLRQPRAEEGPQDVMGNSAGAADRLNRNNLSQPAPAVLPEKKYMSSVAVSTNGAGSSHETNNAPVAVSRQ